MTQKKSKKKKIFPPNAASYNLNCAECETAFVANRKDAIVCSGRCRKRRSLRLQEEKKLKNKEEKEKKKMEMDAFRSHLEDLTTIQPVESDEPPIENFDERFEQWQEQKKSSSSIDPKTVGVIIGGLLVIFIGVIAYMRR